MNAVACTVPGCHEPAVPTAPLPVCARHAAVVTEWAAGEFGVVDALPSACPACGSRLGVRWPSAWLCATCEWRYGDQPDAELPPPRVDVVYYIRFDERTKIGTSSNPRQRLGRLWHDEVLAFERGGRDVERLRHAEFADERFDRTEWFRPSARLERHIAVVRDQARDVSADADPWALYARWRSEAAALRA